MKRTRDAIRHMLLSRQLILVAAGVAMVTLARLLEPRDFGTFATAAAAFAILEVAVRFSLAEYLIREAEATEDDVRAAFGLSLALAGATSAAVLALCLGPWAGLLPRGLGSALLLTVPALLLTPVIQVREAVRQRALDFRLLSRLAVARIVADVGVSIALAWAGWGALALVGGLVADRVIAAATLSLTGGRLRPARGWRRFARFGGATTLNIVTPKAADAAVALVVPWAFGLAALGLYNRAQAVLALLDKTVLDGVAPVILPAFADALRSGRSPAELYGAKTARLTVLIWPVFAVLALTAGPVVRTLLGPQWAGAVPLVRILCATGLVLPFTDMSMPFFAALDRMDEYLRLTLAQQAARIALMGLGALHSLQAVVVGLALSKAIKMWQIRRALHPLLGPEGEAERVRNYARAGVVTVLSIAGPAAILWAAPAWPPVALTAALALAATVGWIAGVVATRHPVLDDARSVWRDGRVGEGSLSAGWRG